MPNLLWVDDDAPHRFRYEEIVLRDEYGWSIAWAGCVQSAVTALCARPFEAIVLDQMLPLTANSRAVGYWGGYALWHWLKACQDPIPRPPPEHESLFVRHTPLSANGTAPVCIVSAFEDLTVQRAIRAACPKIAIFAKPLELDELE